MVHAVRSPNVELLKKQESRRESNQFVEDDAFLSSRSRHVEIRLSRRRVCFCSFLRRSDRHSHEPRLIGAVQCAASHPGADLQTRFYLVILEEAIAGCRQADLRQFVPPPICHVPRNDRSYTTQKLLDHDMIVEHCRD